MDILLIRRPSVKRTGFNIWFWKGFLNPDYLPVQVQQQKEIRGSLTGYAWQVDG